jgi:transposase
LGSEGGLHVFCAVLAWCRFRFVRFACDERADTTLALLAECFEVIGGVPGKVLADRMGCLKGAVVTSVVVPTPAYVLFAAHYGFRPDFCQAADPESKGDRGAPGRLCKARPDGAAGAVRGPGSGERRGRGLVRGGQRRRAQRDLRGAR